ncbi:MAG: hypothetical protein JW967_02645 [Dehalococcoidales bacterium]|nr:hypothetical protein [Dehalococcoidales bacterium]
MSKENKEEKLFNGVIDRILAGESIKIDTADDDLRSTIEFAMKIKELRTSPTEPFKANLKAKLLQQLREKEVQKKRVGWWPRTFQRRIVWQLATTVAVVLIAIGITWRAGFYQPGDDMNIIAQTPKYTDAGTLEHTFPLTGGTATDSGTTETFTVATRQATGIMANVVTDKPDYFIGEDVNIIVSLINNFANTIEFPPFPPVYITDSNGQVMYTSDSGNGVKVLLTGDIYEYSIIWNQFDINNNRNVATGIYYLTVGNIVNASNMTQVCNAPASFTIVP